MERLSVVRRGMLLMEQVKREMGWNDDTDDLGHRVLHPISDVNKYLKVIYVVNRKDQALENKPSMGKFNIF